MNQAYKLKPLALIVLTLLTACHGSYTSKPKAYPRVILPKHEYKMYVSPTCPFQFEIPVYSNVSVDSMYFNKKLEQPCWLNVNFPSLNGTINLTYKEIGHGVTLEKLVEDAHELSYKHTRKADYINEIRVENSHGVGGLVFDVGGDAASNVQFFLTDSIQHFIRGALYFNNEPNTDSMAPVVSFVKADLRQMLKTFEWK